MRKIAWGLLLLFAFAIPWEYSLDLGEPLGNIARIAGLLVLLASVPAVLQVGRLRTPGAMQWVVLALYLWYCCTYFWTLEPAVTLSRITVRRRIYPWLAQPAIRYTAYEDELWFRFSWSMREICTAGRCMVHRERCWLRMRRRTIRDEARVFRQQIWWRLRWAVAF